MSVYIAAGLIIGLSMAVGQAVCALTGATRGSAMAPAVGLAVLLASTRATILLPGRAAAALATLGLLAVGSLVILRPGATLARAVLRSAPTAVVVLALASLPFIANGRIGPLGAFVNDDLAFHLMWADALDSATRPFELIQSGYPVGPHALAETLGTLTGGAEGGFLGLVLAVPALTALTALAALRPLPLALRTVGAVLVGLPFLAAAYLAQGSFKEPLLALMLMGFALQLRELELGEARGAGPAARLGLLVAGCVLTFSYQGLYWPVAIAAAWAAAVLIARGGSARPREARGAAALAALSALVAAAAALPELPRLTDLAGEGISAFGGGETGEGGGGNLQEQIAAYQVFGVWLGSDFRGVEASYLDLTRLLAAVGAASVAFGALWHLRRREVSLPAAAAACLVVYLVARVQSFAFYNAKALMIAAPLVTLVGVRGVLCSLVGDASRRLRVALAVGAALWLGAGAWCSALALRGAQVRPEERGNELASFRPTVRGSAVLLLAHDHYAVWDLRGARVTAPNAYVVPNHIVPDRVRLGDLMKPAPRDRTPDFDTVSSQDLDRFRFAITMRGRYMSVAPPSWRPLRRTASFVLWERHGSTPPRSILDERDGPGAALPCPSPSGTALVRPGPVILPATDWTRPDGGRAPHGATVLGLIPPTVLAEPGKALVGKIELPRGRFELSLAYISPLGLRVRAPGLSVPLPASQSAPGPRWRVGEVHSGGGSLRVSVRVDAGAPLHADRMTQLGDLAATPLRPAPRTLALHRACGRYVDHYRPG